MFTVDHPSGTGPPDPPPSKIRYLFRRFISPAAWLLAGVSVAATADDPPLTEPTVNGSPQVEIMAKKTLPDEMRWAWDVRWGAESSVYLAAGRKGTVEYALAPGNGHVVKAVVPDQGPESLWLNYHVGSSRQFLVAGAPAFELLWKGLRQPSPARRHSFALIADLDVRDDQLLVLGAQRGPEGEWIPDGAIAWIGSLAKGLEDLRPAYYSTEGPGSLTMGYCGSFETGKVRFLADGSFVVVPGVEPGVFLYRADGALAQVWQTERLGIDAECGLSQDEASRLAAQPKPRWVWLNARRIVDEILPLGDTIGLVVRTVARGVTRWEMQVLRPDGGADIVALPIESPSGWSHLRGDVRGAEIAFLLLESGELGEPPVQPPMLLLAKVSG